MRRVKMQLKWTEIFIFVCLFHACSPQMTRIVKEKQEHILQCLLKKDQFITVIWLRTTKDNGVECILSCKHERVRTYYLPELEALGCYNLKIKSFNKQTDSGSYNCAQYHYNKMNFGNATVLEGEPDPTQAPKKVTTTPCAAAPSTPCVCPDRGETSCELIIWAPLAGGCGLLLVLLIAVSLYCNSEHRQAPPKSDHLSPNTDCYTEVDYDLHADISL